MSNVLTFCEKTTETVSLKIKETQKELKNKLEREEREQHCVKSFQIQSYFWSVFSCIRIEYRDLLRKSPYSIRIQENIDQKKTQYLHTFHTVKINATLRKDDEIYRKCLLKRKKKKFIYLNMDLNMDCNFTRK